MSQTTTKIESQEAAAVKLLQAARLLEGIEGADLGAVRMMIDAARSMLSNAIHAAKGTEESDHDLAGEEG